MIRAVRLCVEIIDRGRALRAINEALEELCEDILRRPHILKGRKVTFEVEVISAPEGDKDAPKNYPKVSWRLGRKMPGCGREGMTCFVENGRVMANADDMENPSQGHLFHEDEEDDSEIELPAGKVTFLGQK